MKNLNFFPFERNRYFYGKFLSVDDFESEQRYLNDKRRIVNRYLFGSGVVCGLQVIVLDDFTISVETGMALDFSGRELIVSEPVTTPLSALEGYSSLFPDGRMHSDVFLCIAYEEQGTEPVYNIAGAGSGRQEEFNKYREGFRLFLTHDEPEQEGWQIRQLFEQTKTVYCADGIRIRQSVPRYVRRGEETEIKVFVEKTEQAKKIAFSYQIQLSCLEQEGKSVFEISFDENHRTLSDHYTLVRKIRAKEISNVDASVELIPGSFSLSVAGESKSGQAQGSFSVTVTESALPEAVLANYYNMAMEDLIKDSYHEAVYLAKIQLIPAGDTYVIEKTQNLPFRQCIWNNTLGFAIEALRIQQDADRKHSEVKERQTPPERNRNLTESQEQMIRTGSAVISLGIGGKAGQKFYSQEIIHGLGPGKVQVMLSLAIEKERDETVLICGSQSVFEDTPAIEMAARVEGDKGSFVIGIRCLKQVAAPQLRIFWTAIRQRPPAVRNEAHSMQIRPDIAHLHPRESLWMEAVIHGKVQKDLRWSIREDQGGIIKENGYYTAPDQPGVYEVIAESMEYGLRATAFVIVKGWED